jgi:hypothetical protein
VSLPLACEGIARVAGAPPDGASPFPPLASPRPPADARTVAYDTSDIVGRDGRFGPLARVYAWAPSATAWEHGATWQVRWGSPFRAGSEVHESLPAVAPPVLADAARPSNGLTLAQPLLWALALGDEPSHALLVTRKSARSEAFAFALEEDRAPVEIRRADGEPFGEIDAAVRGGGRWYLATPPEPGGPPEAVVWQLDGPIARELSRIPRRALNGASPTAARLAWRTDGRALGYVVDGQPFQNGAGQDRAGATRWVAAIDLDTGELAEVASLGASDLGDRASLPACTGDDVGWRLDTPVVLPVSIYSGGIARGAVHGVYARLRIGETRACVEALAGSLDAAPLPAASAPAPSRPAPPATSAASGAGQVRIAVGSGRERRVLTCGVR